MLVPQLLPPHAPGPAPHRKAALGSSSAAHAHPVHQTGAATGQHADAVHQAGADAEQHADTAHHADVLHHAHTMDHAAVSADAAGSDDSAAADLALLARQQTFDMTAKLQAENEREMNVLRDMAMAQLKKDDETLKKWIAMI